VRLTRFGLVLGLVLLSTVSVASAQGSLDLVELSNGGFVRGTVLVYEPGQPVVVQLPNGTTRTLQPNEVARVRMGGAAAPSPPSSAPPRPPSAPPRPPVAAPPAQAAPSIAPAARAPGDDAARRLVSAPPAESGAWRLDDGRDGEDWPDLTERYGYRPRGVVHFGVAGGIGVVSAFGPYNLEGTGFGAEAAAVLELRPDSLSPYRLRFEGVLGVVAHQSGFRVPYVLRVFFLGLDLHDWVVWRFGGEIGGHAGQVSDIGNDGLYAGPVTELALTPADRRLEIGVLFGSPFAFGTYDWVASFQATVRLSYLF
jgi:hypothetical protein